MCKKDIPPIICKQSAFNYIFFYNDNYSIIYQRIFEYLNRFHAYIMLFDILPMYNSRSPVLNITIYYKNKTGSICNNDDCQFSSTPEKCSNIDVYGIFIDVIFCTKEYKNKKN